MRLFLVAAFALLAALFWIASGGSAFDPPERTVAAPREEAAPAEPIPPPAPLTQVETEEEPPVDAAEIAAFDRAAAAAEAEGGAPDPVVLEPGGGSEGAAPGGAEPGTSGAIEDALSQALDLRTVSGTAVNVRSGPGTGFDVVAQVLEGARAEVLDEEGGWSRIRTEDGRTGWMSSRFLR